MSLTEGLAGPARKLKTILKGADRLIWRSFDSEEGTERLRLSGRSDAGCRSGM